MVYLGEKNTTNARFPWLKYGTTSLCYFMHLILCLVNLPVQITVTELGSDVQTGRFTVLLSWHSHNEISFFVVVFWYWIVIVIVIVFYHPS